MLNKKYLWIEKNLEKKHYINYNNNYNYISVNSNYNSKNILLCVIIFSVLILLQSSYVVASLNSAENQYIVNIGPIAGSTLANYAYASIYNPTNSTKNISITKIIIKSDAVAAAVYQSITIRRISNASVGILISNTDIPKKNSQSQNSVAEIRSTNVNVTLSGTVSSRLMSVVGSGAAGSSNGYKDLIISNSDEQIILTPGQGLVLYQEAAGSANQLVKVLFEWDELSGANTPAPLNEYLFTTPRVEVNAVANYVYHSMFNPLTTNRTVLIKKISIELSCDAAAVYTNNINLRRITAASAGTLTPTADIPKKNTLSNNSFIEFRNTNPAVTFSGDVNNSKLAMVTPCGAANQKNGVNEIVFDNDTGYLILMQGEGIALSSETAGDIDQIVKMSVEWQEISNTSNPTPTNRYIYSSPRVEFAATPNYVYQTFLNPTTSNVTAIIRSIEIRVDADAAAVYQPISIRKINLSTGGTQVTSANVSKKDTRANSTLMEFRYLGPSVNFSGDINSSRLLSITGTGAVGQLHATRKITFDNNEKLILNQGEGLALYSEAAGDVDQYVKWSIEWEEVSNTSTPVAQNEYLLNTYVSGLAAANYNYTSIFNPLSSNKTIIINSLGISIDAAAAAVYIPFSLRKINSSSGGNLLSSSNFTKKNNASNSSVLQIRNNQPSVNYTGDNNSRMDGVQSPGTVGTAVAPQLTGFEENIFENEKIILLPGEGLVLYQEGAGDVDFRVKLFLDWGEIPLTQNISLVGDNILSIGPVAGSLTANYTYAALFNPNTSNKYYAIKKLGVRSDRIGALTVPGYINITLASINSSSGGTLLNNSLIPKKNNITNLTLAQIRYAGTSVNFSKNTSSKILTFNAPGAVGQNYGDLELLLSQGKELVLSPGEGLALYQESVPGDINLRYRFDIVWNESVVDQNPPNISYYYPSTGQIISNNLTINITANISDYTGINGVNINLTLSNGSKINTLMSNFSGNSTNRTYSYNFTTSGIGIYNFTITANDTWGYQSNITSYVFLSVPSKILSLTNTSNNGLNYTENVLSNNSGILDIEILPTENIIKSIVIMGYNESSLNKVFRIDTNVSSIGQNISEGSQTYALNLDELNYTNATFTITALGNNLLKCYNYTFATSTCNDENPVMISSNLTPGENYTIFYNGTDPAYYETIKGVNSTLDTYLGQGNVNSNFGGATTIRVGKSTASNALRGLIQFNISIPRGAIIENANLSLYFSSIPGSDSTGLRTHNLHKVSVSRPWQELQATWNRYNTTNTWTTAGGDRNVTLTSNATFSSSSLNTYIIYNVTNDLQYFVDNNIIYFGWILLDSNETTLNTRRYYDSSESTNSSRWPTLTYILSQGPSRNYLYNLFYSNFTNYSFLDGNFTNSSFNFGNFSIMLNTSLNNGFYTSQIFDAEYNASWNDITLSSTTVGNITINVRSCDDSVCSGESFTNISNQKNSTTNLTVPINRYFQYLINLTRDSSNSTQIYNITINYTIGDLTISNGRINFSKNNPVENESILIFAQINNPYNLTYNNITASFYEGDPDVSGIIIGNVTFNITDINKTINASWNTKIGLTNIYVRLDSANFSLEINESNNKAFNISRVSAWQIFYGNATILVNALGFGNVSLINWSVGPQKINIYVSDYDSSIDWTLLKAVSRNISGEQSSLTLNDFEEIDLAIGYDLIDDSVNYTYTNSGLPIGENNYTVRYSSIVNVPVAESTNNANFYTGILWDSSDTALTYYNYNSNSSLRPDLVFVSEVEFNKTGAYGLYDYELRIPGHLKNYKGNSDTISFYYELE